MYWPAVIIDKNERAAEFRVRYDNGSDEWVPMDYVQPSEVPLGYGEEGDPYEPGEFVEVFNDSKTDPAEWLGVIVRAAAGENYIVDYPFCDSKAEKKHAVRPPPCPPPYPHLHPQHMPCMLTCNLYVHVPYTPPCRTCYGVPVCSTMWRGGGSCSSRTRRGRPGPLCRP